MSAVLVIGATRGLGASLVRRFAATGNSVVYGTSRSSTVPTGFPEHVKWLSAIDLMKRSVGDDIVKYFVDSKPLSTVVRLPRNEF